MRSKPSKPSSDAGLQGSRAGQRLPAPSPQASGPQGGAQIPHRQNAGGQPHQASNHPDKAPQAFLIEIQNPPWAPFYVKHLHKDRTFMVTHAREEAWAFADQDAETLAMVTAEVAGWPLKPGPVLYVLKGI